MILHEINKQILENLCDNIRENHINKRLNWYRKSPTQVSFKNEVGEVTFNFNKFFTVQHGWAYNPGFWTLKVGDLTLNLHFTEYNILKEISEDIIKNELEDLSEENLKATEKLKEFTKSMSIEHLREKKIETLLGNDKN